MTASSVKSPRNFVVYPGWLIRVIPDCHAMKHRGVVVVDGKIADILSRADCEARYPGLPAYELPSHLLIPGLINMHGHLAMTLLRGYADDLPLTTWLEKHIWPAEKQWVDAEFVADGTRLAMAEMLAGGTTCFSDQYFFPDQVARAAIEAGMRAQIAFPIMDFPIPGAADPQSAIHQGLSLYDHYKNHSLIQIAFGPHAPYTLNNENLGRVVTMAGEVDAAIQIHLHETAEEIERSIDQYGVRPIQRLYDLGLLGPRTQCVHMTQIEQSDLHLMAETNAHLIHCPASNLKLSSGQCPTWQVMAAGINLAIGTDGAASNNRLDMLDEIRLAALLAKAGSGSPQAMPAAEALAAATIGGARALGLEDQIGSIEKGKQADLVAINLDQLSTQPLYDPLSQLVYACQSHQVSHTWVAGKLLYERGELKTLHRPTLLKRARHWADRIKGASND